jgi:predicted small lipoprotein YifL
MILRVSGARAVPIPYRPFPILAVLILATALSACGRRGPLEPPPRAAAPAASVLADEPEAAPAGEALPSLAPPVAAGDRVGRKPIVAPKRPFILDPLL